jgi:Flp pilus assembly protein TadD
VIGLRALLAVGCVAGAVAALVAYDSEGNADRAYRSLAYPARAVATRALVEDARPLNPDRGLSAAQALSYSAEDRYALANRMMERIVREEPENLDLVLAWSRIQVRAGQLDAARRTYARARELDPQLGR